MKIAGPAYITYKYGEEADKVMTAFSSSDITVSITNNSREVAPKHFNGQFDDIYLYSTADIKFTPVEWKNHDILYPWAGATVGSPIFGASDKETKIYSADGLCYTFPKTALFGVGALSLGVDKDIVGECTIKALPPRTEEGLIDKLFTVSEAAFNPPELDSAKIFTIPYKAVITKEGMTEFGWYHMEDGVEISFELTTTEVKCAGLPADYIFGGAKISGKFTPYNTFGYTSKAFEDEMRSWLGDDGVQTDVGRARSPHAFDIKFEPLKPLNGDPIISFPSVIFTGDSQRVFSKENGRFGEFTFTALTRAYGTPSFSITDYKKA